MTATTPVDASVDPAPEGHVHEHPSDWQYAKIAILLGLLTALEVGTYFWEDIFGSEPSTAALIATLFPMMFIKFVTVAGYFMHLKYDNPIFKRIFIFGLILAVGVFVAALFAFEFWSDDYFRFLRG
ncbi:MAG: cytochrome C oxidase subunit IV family protein [Acidimicrobiales bacterium]|nr:cytochrome C oxidase subunit IV family protein [Acidimicrobiales bacterium]